MSATPKCFEGPPPKKGPEEVFGINYNAVIKAAMTQKKDLALISSKAMPGKKVVIGVKEDGSMKFENKTSVDMCEGMLEKHLRLDSKHAQLATQHH